MKYKDSVPEIELLPMSGVQPSPNNPRKTFSEESLQELAENIRQQGLLQPITVRYTVKSDPKTGREMYEIVCGERRYRACLKLGMTEIPCIVREMTDEEAFDAMITENLQRRDVDPIEEAVAFRLLHERGQSATDLAARFGKSVRYIQDRMHLNSLLEPIRKAVSAGDIPIRGGYLLARLSTDDQQAWLDEQWDEEYAEGDITVSDIEQWLDHHFRKLWMAPFQNGEDLTEAWNPDGSLIRRCVSCDCNTCNQGCLFADMNTDEPQCTNATCYSRKLDIYYDWIIRREAKLILCGDEQPQPGRVALVGDESGIYNEEMKARFRQLKERCEAQGYAVFTEKQLPTRVWSDGEKEVEAGRAIHCLNLTDMARGFSRKSEEYRRIPGTPSATTTASNYPAQLSERAAAIESQANKKMNKYAHDNFDRGKYISRTSALEPWEEDIVAAIVFRYLGYDDSKELMGEALDPTYQQMHDFRQKQGEYGADNRWMRRAIAKFVNDSNHDSYLRELITRLDPLAAPTFSKIRKDSDKRIRDIHDELHELGYDERANKL